MIHRVLGTALLAGLVAEQPSPPTVGCHNTHEWVNVGQFEAKAVVGRVEVRYSGGDLARLPEATVIVARVQPSIQAYVTHTDNQGEFTTPDVPEGRWRVNVCKAGFKTLEADLVIDGKAAQEVVRFTTELDW